jgi:hypothetical protein
MRDALEARGALLGWQCQVSSSIVTSVSCVESVLNLVIGVERPEAAAATSQHGFHSTGRTVGVATWRFIRSFKPRDRGNHRAGVPFGKTLARKTDLITFEGISVAEDGTD